MPDPAGRLELGVLPDLLGFHLRLASAAVARDFLREMEPLDLTQKQFAVLELVASNAEVSQVDVAATLGTDRATMMALVDRLEMRGLMTRRPSVRDRRRQDLALTDAGIDLLTRARAAIDDHERRFVERFDPSEMQTLIRLLQRLV